VTIRRYLRRLYHVLNTVVTDPGMLVRAVNAAPSLSSAYRFSGSYADKGNVAAAPPPPQADNPLWNYFQSHREGPGIWKWEHYFEIYHRHFARFVGTKVDVLEIGIFSGGSLEMWRAYFGDQSHIYGVDIEDACRSYQNDHVSVFIGDQADRSFWRDFKSSVAGIDIIIDDGGHSPEQQQVTLEEMLPHLRPGGVYLCEDITGTFNRFASFATGLVNELNRQQDIPGPELQSSVSTFQSQIHSIHFYPFVAVIEKNYHPLARLSGPRHGTEWQPFL
jgi:hypothetical protein